MTKRNKFLVNKVSMDLPAILKKNKQVKAKDVFDLKSSKKNSKNKKKKNY
jgi:hypothetical protein